MVLNRNPVNYFAEVEQLAFDPSNMPPGIEPSPDKMLQVRFFPNISYWSSSGAAVHYLSLSSCQKHKINTENFEFASNNHDGSIWFWSGCGGVLTDDLHSLSAKPKLDLTTLNKQIKNQPCVNSPSDSPCSITMLCFASA